MLAAEDASVRVKQVSELRLEVQQLQALQAEATSKSTKLEAQLGEARERLQGRMDAADERAPG